MQRGMTAYAQHNWEAAATALREAATADPRSAQPALHLGFVARARDDAATAMAQFREAQRIAMAEGDAASRARALAFGRESPWRRPSLSRAGLLVAYQFG